jgi:hypothetical protein
MTLLTMYVFSTKALWFVTHGLVSALKIFLPKLQDHLLGRLTGREFDGDMHEEFTDSN